jgi:hypothetical protein
MSSAKPSGPVGRELAMGGGAGGLMLPPPPRLPAKRKEVVLEEDDWTATLEAIIERDFFPELPKLESKIAWLQVGAVAGLAVAVNTWCVLLSAAGVETVLLLLLLPN